MASSEVKVMPIRSTQAPDSRGLPHNGPENDVYPLPIMDRVRWLAGFIRTWISTLSVSLPCPSETVDDTEHHVASSDMMENFSISKGLPTRARVRAVFFRSFLESVITADERVSQLLENGIIISQVNKYGRQICRVSDALYAYFSHYLMSPIPDISFYTAMKALDADQTQGDTPEVTRQAAYLSPNDLLLVTEEIYVGEPTDFPYEQKPRHNFVIRSVKASEILDLQSQDVLILTADHWRSLDAADISYYDYILACDEQPYTTFLDFIARLHIITSPSYVSIATDGRLFVADNLLILYSPYDSLQDTPGRESMENLLSFPES